MPGGILDNWFGRKPTPSADVAEALADLARMAAERPSLAAPSAMLADVLPRIFADADHTDLPALSSETARTKHASGIPLLRNESLKLDAVAFQRRWRAVCSGVAKHQDSAGGQLLADAVERGHFDASTLLADVLAGHPDQIHERAARHGYDPALTAAVLGLVLYPTLSRVQAALASRKAVAGWPHGICPFCGSWPLLGEFRGLEQIRYLRCGLCAGEWEFARLLCPYCGEQDHRRLGYFGVEGEESRHRATTCESCRGYVKMASTLAPLSPPALLGMDVATLHLDLVAGDRGYASPR